MIDILDLKNADYLKFYEDKGFIYCENTKTCEKVIVSDLICDRCKKQDKSVKKCLDPYDKEINEILTFTNLCDECYQERADAI